VQGLAFDHINTHIDILSTLAKSIDKFSSALAKEIVKNYRNGGIVLWAGNGGSASQASHLAAELMGKYVLEREPIPSYALSADSSVVTCISNDFGYASLYTRQIISFSKSSKVVVLLSTSGKSPNILSAAEYCRDNGIPLYSLTSDTGLRLETLSDQCLVCPSSNTGIIQEIHLVAGHLACAKVDQHFAQEFEIQAAKG